LRGVSATSADEDNDVDGGDTVPVKAEDNILIRRLDCGLFNAEVVLLNQIIWLI